jgi:hypothetical protein
MGFSKQNQQQDQQKKGPTPQNYKLVKCKFWEKDGTCRYGSLCTFAHGDTEVRQKTDNFGYQMGGQQQMGNFDYSGMGFDPNMMMQMGMMNPYMGYDMTGMQNPQMMNFPEGFDPNMMSQMNPMMMNPMMMNPNMMNPNSNQQGFQNPFDQNNEEGSGSGNN